jgi:hypothetical protein
MLLVITLLVLFLHLFDFQAAVYNKYNRGNEQEQVYALGRGTTAITMSLMRHLKYIL